MSNIPSPRLTRATRSPLASLRLLVGRVAGEVAALASRVLGKGSGASIRGKVLTLVYPDAFASLLGGRRIVAVSGTNGKTTTTHLLAAAIGAGLGDDAGRLATNADGANLHYGIASALAKAPRADLAVLETDERVVADLVAEGRPEVLVLLNCSDDQLDRNPEIGLLARSWRDALERAGEDGPVVVANSNDPLITWAVEPARRIVWVDASSTWSASTLLCPACGGILERTEADSDVAQGRWGCTSCSLSEHRPDYRARDDRISLPDETVVDPQLKVPGSFNVANAACALAAAVTMGVRVEDALRGFRTVEAPAGRFSVRTFDGVSARLILSKNADGWAESLSLLNSPTVVLAIDAQAADGRDLSWLWDVDFEQLADKHVVCTGARAWDLAVRLEYADVPHEVIMDLDDALRAVAPEPQPVDLLATYTPFRKLLKMAGPL